MICKVVYIWCFSTKKGLLNMGNQGEMGFWESSWGVVGDFWGILVLVGFWYLVAILFLVISAKSVSVLRLLGLSHH